MPKHLVHLDEEQFQLVAAAADLVDQALSIRAQRMDPEQEVTKALQLQRRKMKNLKQQLSLPPVPDWANLTDPERVRFVTLSEAVFRGADRDRAFLWEQMTSLILASQVKLRR